MARVPSHLASQAFSFDFDLVGCKKMFYEKCSVMFWNNVIRMGIIICRCAQKCYFEFIAYTLILRTGIGDIMIDNRKQWFLLGFVTLWLLTALILPIAAFCLTNNAISLSFFGTLAPPVIVLQRITKTLFPPGDNETKIALAKQHRKKPVP
jgi:hypothetical protein